MTPDRLEQILDGGQETDTIEFKAAISWNKLALVKDILALSNTIDGGVIVIGVEDKSFKREGMTEEQISTYDIDIMKDQISPYADPMVSFTRQVITDKNGLKYVVIEVSTFEDVPIICSKGGTDVDQGVIYYRSRTRRSESARVSNSSDMRDIIESAISRRSRKLLRNGFKPSVENSYDFDAELKGL